MSNPLEWLWLAYVLGPGGQGCADLLSAYESPAQVLDAVGKEDLSAFLTPTQCARLSQRPEKFGSVLRRCERMNIRLLCMDEEDYPRRLLTIPDPPPVLYCTGDVRLLNEMPTVGMIGSRRPSQYGMEAAGLIGGQLADAGVCIVSGLADGLDGRCHRAAVEHSAPTVGVLGTAIDRTYPAGNLLLRRQMEDNGAVLSEFGPGELTKSFGFLLRNRLIAALSDALCVVEAREKSGTMNTVGHAHRYGKTVFAVPGTIFSNLCAGTNRMLEEGTAQAAAGAGPILNCLGLGTEKTGEKPARASARAAAPKSSPRPAPTVELSPNARIVLGQLTGEAKSAEQIAMGADTDMGSVLAALLELELSGLAESCAGGQYRRK